MMCFTVCNKVHAQNPVTYGYDDSGNRVSRVVVLALRSSKEETTTTGEEKVYGETLKDFTVRIYPNPTKGDLTVEIRQLQEGQTVTLRLYGMSGKLIHHKNDFHGGTEKFNIGKQPAGIYVLKIISGDSSTDWKIIKQ